MNCSVSYSLICHCITEGASAETMNVWHCTKMQKSLFTMKFVRPSYWQRSSVLPNISIVHEHQSLVGL